MPRTIWIRFRPPPLWTMSKSKQIFFRDSFPKPATFTFSCTAVCYISQLKITKNHKFRITFALLTHLLQFVQISCFYKILMIWKFLNRTRKCLSWTNCRKWIFQYLYLKNIQLIPFFYTQVYQRFEPTHKQSNLYLS